MPELPDVEGFKRVLSRTALRKTIGSVVVSDARILGELTVAVFAARLRGAKLVSVRRHGKHLMARIDRGGWLTLHFGLTGGLHFVRGADEAPAFTRVRLDFAGDGCLAYTNKRMIGRVGIAEDASDFVASEKLGPDALDPKWDFEAFQRALAGTRRDVKSALMDQEIVAGIGNIYSDEILFQARIDPATPAGTITRDKLKTLLARMRDVLEAAIEHGAGSEVFEERMPKGFLLPERRKGGHCPRCGTPLKVSKTGGRTSYCCTRCQGC